MKKVKKLNKINNRNYGLLLKSIGYQYYSKRYNTNKEEIKLYNKGQSLIKRFPKEILTK